MGRFIYPATSQVAIVNKFLDLLKDPKIVDCTEDVAIFTMMQGVFKLVKNSVELNTIDTAQTVMKIERLIVRGLHTYYDSFVKNPKAPVFGGAGDLNIPNGGAFVMHASLGFTRNKDNVLMTVMLIRDDKGAQEEKTLTFSLEEYYPIELMKFMKKEQ